MAVARGLLLVVLTSACDSVAPIALGTETCAVSTDCASGQICHQNHCLKLPTACNLDGIVQRSEQCDDGNEADTDACTNECTLARCGDGVLRSDLWPSDPGFEQCEPELSAASDYCTSDCQQGEPRRMLVTSANLSCALINSQVRCWGAQLRNNRLTLLSPFTVSERSEAVDLGLLYTYSPEGDFRLYQRALSGVVRASRFAGDPLRVEPLAVDRYSIGHNYLAADAHDLAQSACHVTPAGKVGCWGVNTCGQVLPLTRPADPNSDEFVMTSPVLVQGLRAVRSVAMTASTSCALKRDGTVHCWGATEDWFEHLDALCPRVAPIEPIEGVEGIVALTAHRFGYTGVTAESVTYSWGRDWEGEPLVEPARRVLPETAVQLGASDDTECVLFESGRVGCWGAYRGEGNRAGNTLRMLEGLEEVVEISDGRNTKHLCARRSDDEIWCWGNNTYGQLGDGSRDSSAAPVRVRGL